MTTNAEAIGLPFEEAIDFFRQKTRMPSQRWTDVMAEAHSRSFMVAGAASDALLSDFQREIQRAVEGGVTLGDFRKSFDTIVAKHGWAHTGTPGWRASIIYETNLSTAHSAGRYAQQTDPDVQKVFPFWTYVHSGSRHPRLNHLSWNGLTLAADDPWWKTHYPPNGWRCGCRVSSTSRRALGRMGKSGPDEAPPLDARPWTNPTTGEVRQVPRGIDPGFDYNPGEAWKRGGGTPTATPRADTSPPGGGVATGPVSPEALRSFVRSPQGTVQVGTLPAAIVEALGAASDAVLLSEQTMEKQAQQHADLTAEDYLALQPLLADPAGVFDWGERQVLMVARQGDRLRRAVVKVTRDRSEAYVVSFHRIDENRLPGIARRGRLLLGSSKGKE